MEPPKTDLLAVPLPELTPAAVAERLEISPGTVYRWIHAGGLPALRVGGRYRVDVRDVELMVQPAHTDGGDEA